jgi:DNA-binding NarL/FixJ family response regulator
MSGQTIRVLIADDRPPARAGLRALLATVHPVTNWAVYTEPGLKPLMSIEVVGEASDGQEAVQMVTELHPDVVVMDARMPKLDGLEATRQIKEHIPGTRIIILTMYGTHRDEAFAAGADAFLVKGCPPEELLESIENTRQGGKSHEPR